jgi:lysozyme
MQIVNDSLIKKWEQLVLKAYKPTPDDVWTIGWGHTKGVVPGMVITAKQAQDFFEIDTAWVEATIAKFVKVPLSQHQYDATASIIFNIGASQFLSSTLLRKLNAKDYKGAAAEFPKWNKQKGKVLKGLVRRRDEEMQYFLTPDKA